MSNSGLQRCFPSLRVPECSRQNGLSYVEILIAITLIAVALVPAINALFPAMIGSANYRSDSEQHYHLAAKLETVLAENYTVLDEEAVGLADRTTPSMLFSDTAGSEQRRLVFLSRYQPGDALVPIASFTTDDVGMLWVSVSLENDDLKLESLVSQYD